METFNNDTQALFGSYYDVFTNEINEYDTQMESGLSEMCTKMNNYETTMRAEIEKTSEQMLKKYESEESINFRLFFC